jgi:hypothetical protein
LCILLIVPLSQWCLFCSWCNFLILADLGIDQGCILNKSSHHIHFDTDLSNKGNIPLFLPEQEKIVQPHNSYKVPCQLGCCTNRACRANKTPPPSRFERNPMGRPRNLFRCTSQPFPKSNLGCIFYTTILHWHPELQDHTCQCHNWCRRILWWHQNQHSIFLWKKKSIKKRSVTYHFTFKHWNQKLQFKQEVK